jgi:hypothetical protein
MGGASHEFWYQTDDANQATSIVVWMFGIWRASHSDKWDYHLEQTINYEVDPQSGNVAEHPSSCYLVLTVRDDEIARSVQEKFGVEF